MENPRVFLSKNLEEKENRNPGSARGRSVRRKMGIKKNVGEPKKNRERPEISRHRRCFSKEKKQSQRPQDGQERKF